MQAVGCPRTDVQVAISSKCACMHARTPCVSAADDVWRAAFVCRVCALIRLDDCIKHCQEQVLCALPSFSTSVSWHLAC